MATSPRVRNLILQCLPRNRAQRTGVFGSRAAPIQAVLLALTLLGPAWAQGDSFEQAPILYSETAPADPVASWMKRLREGSLLFNTTSAQTFLADVLEELEISPSSQVLVFSKTSQQNDRIHPQQPRAIYFSQDSYVGWVQGGHLEIISTDPLLGPVFYTMTVPSPSPSPEEPADLPAVVRSRECLSCHQSSRTKGVPGMLVRSVRPDARGFPILRAGTYLTEPRSPLRERWGGWYVTGSNGGERHMGNLLYEEGPSGEVLAHTDPGSSLETLSKIFPTAPYLETTSDIVALMVLEHQIAVHNALTRAHYATRRILHHQKELRDILPRLETREGLSDTSRRVIEGQARDLLREMLFVDEFPLESWGVEGNPAFQEAFLEKANRCDEGRSLRDFDLLSHLFSHRLSYMMYSRSFEHLPAVLKEMFYEKLFAILDRAGDDDSDLGAHLGEKEAARIREIVLQTKDDLPVHLSR